MYQEKFVCSLKVDGRFLRDEKGEIKIPFGTDYSLYLKNVDSRDAIVKVSIDGEDVLDGNRLVVRGNSSMDLMGFMNGNQVRKAFRFIELTKDIEDHIGYNPEDSLIRIEVWYEKMKPVTQDVYTVYHNYPWNPYPHIYWTDITYNNANNYATRRGSGTSTSLTTNFEDALMSFNCANYTSDVGITVKGEDCHQDFGSAYVSDLESQSHVMVLRLSGYKDANKKVEMILTTKDKVECPTCGKKNEYNNRFCSSCGTALK